MQIISKMELDAESYLGHAGVIVLDTFDKHENVAFFHHDLNWRGHF